MVIRQAYSLRRWQRVCGAFFARRRFARFCWCSDDERSRRAGRATKTSEIDRWKAKIENIFFFAHKKRKSLWHRRCHSAHARASSNTFSITIKCDFTMIEPSVSLAHTHTHTVQLGQLSFHYASKAAPAKIDTTNHFRKSALFSHSETANGREASRTLPSPSAFGSTGMNWFSIVDCVRLALIHSHNPHELGAATKRSADVCSLTCVSSIAKCMADSVSKFALDVPILCSLPTSTAISACNCFATDSFSLQCNRLSQDESNSAMRKREKMKRKKQTKRECNGMREERNYI